MTLLHWINPKAASASAAASIHTISLLDLAKVCDALMADGRADLATDVVRVLFYCAERQSTPGRVIAFPRPPASAPPG